MTENTDNLEQILMIAAVESTRGEYACKSDSDSLSDSKEVDKEAPPSNPIKNKRKHEEISQPSSNREDDAEPNRSIEDKPGGIKRKHVESSEATNHSQIVATHYNLIEEKGVDERSKSRIFHLRTFHNWIKSMLINEYLTKIKESKKQHNTPIRVLDMCCGKGGDLLKWKKGNISYLICSDIAEISLKHCKQRYADMKERSQRERGRHGGSLFVMEVVHGDMGKIRLREKFTDPSIKLDLVSCQFSFHYIFGSLAEAECMMKNASECLQPGGFFIGTMTDSNQIIARARKSEDRSFGNDVYQVFLEFDPANPPLFGGQYTFQLDEVVNNCPEFIVHFPTFVKLAKKYGLKLVRKETFWEFFERMKDEGRSLLSNMLALECYPPNEGTTLMGDSPDDYLHAKEFVRKQDKPGIKIGTLSKSEWEASSLYLTFSFVKVKNTWNADGTPCYEI